MNKLVYLGSSVIDLSKTVIYKFWYDYVKPKYGENKKTADVYENIVEDVETRFDT